MRKLLMNKKTLMNDKRGLSGQIMAIIIMAIVLILIMLIVFIGQLVLPPLVSSVQDTSSIVQTAFQSSGNQDLIAAGDASFVPASQSLNNLEWVSYTMFVILFLVFLIMCFYVRTYPFLLVIWIILIVILLIVSIYLAVVYQDLRVSPGLDTYYQSWENTDFFLRYLPGIILIMGVVGGIIMFVISSREQEAELGSTGL